VPVVGVTACSSLLSALDGQRFEVLVLDESSQMVEPLSAVPLLRCQARFLVAAGDPLQLPPVVAAPPHVTATGGAPRQGPPHGLLRPLFVRLAALGAPPYLLRRQYRCHPDIAAVPNAQFYGGRLLDGCSREARASLVHGLPSLAFLDVRGQESYGTGEDSCAPDQPVAPRAAPAESACV
jgi:superfamily I DNA and/or RNA helicase